MEQTVGEIIDALSKFDRNTRIKSGHEIELKYDGASCRLINKRIDFAVEEIENVHEKLDAATDHVESAFKTIESLLYALRK